MGDRASSARIVLTSGFLANYLSGGGHWSWFLQYLLGLRALGHDVFVLELLGPSGDAQADSRLISSFFDRMERYGFRDETMLALATPGEPVKLEDAAVYGIKAKQLFEIAATADFVWNMCGAIRGPLLSRFRRRVLIDTDPGIYQLSAASWDMGIDEHDVLLTVGANVGKAGCEVPTLGRTWHTFRPFVHIPAWPLLKDPGSAAPFTSVTHWTWDDDVFEWQGTRISMSKRTAYLRYLDLPRLVGPPFELAAHIHPLDDTGDREMLETHGWSLADPLTIAGSPEEYRSYIQRSRAEFTCVKPVYSVLCTGWFSDRSVCYLASGRPVVCEDTGLAGHIPIGQGLLTVSSPEEAVSAVDEIDSDYSKHSRAARELGETLFDARTCLAEMIAVSQ